MKNPTKIDVPFSAPRQKTTDKEEKPTVDNEKGKTYSKTYVVQQLR